MKKCLFGILLGSSLLLSAQENTGVEWHSASMGGGGNWHNIFCSPSDPERVLVIPDVGGMYCTENGGKSWRRTGDAIMNDNRGYGLGIAAYAPGNPKRIYAGTPHMLWCLFRGGTYGGHTTAPESLWEKFGRRISCGVIRTDDGGKHWTLLPGTAEMIGSIAVDPEDENTLWVASGNRQNVGHRRFYPVFHPVGPSICRSADGGRSWKVSYVGVKNGVEGNQKKIGYSSLRISKNSPRGRRTLYVASTAGIFKSTDHGISWVDVSGDLPHNDVEQIDLYDAPDGKNHILFAALQNRKGVRGIFRSRNGSGKWENISGDLPLSRIPGGFLHIAVSRQTPDIIYAAPGRGINDQGRAERGKGIYKTIDGGKHWVNVFRTTGPSPNGDPVSWFNAGGYGDIVEAMSLSAMDDRILYVADGGCKLYRTIDGGNSWQQIFTRRLADGSYTSRGCDSFCVLDLAFHPRNPDCLYLAENDFMLLTSRNHGRSWFANAQMDINKERTPIGTTSLAVLPEEPDLVFAGIHGWSSEGKNGIFCVSENAGESWSVRSSGQGRTPAFFRGNPILYNRYITSILPLTKDHIFITKRTGLMESLDGGRTWRNVENGISEKDHFRFHQLYRHPVLKNTLFAVAGLYPQQAQALKSPLTSYPGELTDAERVGGLYRSDDLGRTWKRITTERILDNAFSFEISPDGKVWYLSILSWCERPEDQPFRFYSGGLFRSRDEGKTWERILKSRNRLGGGIRQVIVHPCFPQILYALFTELYERPEYSGVLRSMDGGKSWECISRDAWNPMQNGIRINPKRPEYLYLLTAGRGLMIGKDLSVEKLLQKRGH